MRLILILILFSQILLAQYENSDSLKILARTVKNSPEKVDVLANLADKLRKNSEFDEALKYALQALNLAVQIDDTPGLAKANSFLGLIYRDKSEYEIGLQYFIRGLEIATEIDDEIQIAYAYNNIGTINILRSDYSTGMSNLITALKIFEEMNNSKGISYTSLNIARLLLAQNRPDEALENLTRVLDIRKASNDKLGIARTYQYIAEAYSIKKKYSIAQEYLDLTEEMLVKSGSKNRAFYAAVNVQKAENILNQDKYSEAANLYLEALKDFKSTDDKNNLAKSYLKLAEINLKLNELSKTKKYLDLTVNIAETLDIKRVLENSFRVYSDYYFKINNISKSFDYFKKYTELKDELFSETKERQFEELKIQYETDKMIKENDVLKTELSFKEKSNIYLVTIVVLSIIVILFTLLVYSSKVKTNKQLTELISTKDRFFSIISHDLRNPFGSIMNNASMFEAYYEEMTEEDKKEMIQMINRSTKKVYELLDNLLNWARSQQGELVIKFQKINISDMLEDLSELMKNNLNAKKITFELDTEKDLYFYADKNTISSVLHNLVSNAIKFTPVDGKIKARCYKDYDKLKIQISDNGIGMEEDQLEKLFKIDHNIHKPGTNGEPGSGLGLILCKEFVDKNNGEIYVESKINNGTTFNLIFPVFQR